MSTKKEHNTSHKIILRIRLQLPAGIKGEKILRQYTSRHSVYVDEVSIVSKKGCHTVQEMLAYFVDPDQCHSFLQDLSLSKDVSILLFEDELLRIHRGGKIAVVPRVRLETIQDLRKVYTPGVAQVCDHIVANPQTARDYTSIGNTVCIATNGSAVLGLGNIGVAAGMPVMEGKSLIIQKMAQANCIPILIDTQDGNTIVETLSSIARTFSLIMIEDIAAPTCFYVEDELQKRVSIPVFHDDQHGTATVVLAALIRILRLSGKKRQSASIVINGAGAAGIATAKLLLEYGFKDIVLCDKAGALYAQRERDMNPYKQEIARMTNTRSQSGTLAEIMKHKDIFIGLSAPNIVTKEMVQTMNKKPVVLALANPVPEIWPENAMQAGAAFALDGRMVNNALAFPGIIRGALDSGARRVTTAMKCGAAEAIASCAVKSQVVPDFMKMSLHAKVADAVKNNSTK